MQVSFTPLGFNPHTSQVCFAATVTGANGQENFNYSGGILAFIPRTKKVPGVRYGETVEVPFDLWAELKKKFRFELQTTNVEAVIRGIRAGRVDSRKNVNCPEVQRVFRQIAAFAQPDAAGLIYSLMLDASADGMTFVEWCREYGYSDDSIKAEGIYRACVETARKLQRILSKEEMAEAQKIASEQ